MEPMEYVIVFIIFIIGTAYAVYGMLGIGYTEEEKRKARRIRSKRMEGQRCCG